ncbi:MAG: ion transporter [Phaeodactylibacter sp.]|nr:ion transporter [Phaeodactylibacter sp.]
MKKRTYELLNISGEKGDLSWWVDVFLISLILLNALALILETVEPVYQQHQEFFYYFELISVIIFSIEYVLRVWSANESPKYSKPFSGNIRYALTPLALIDLLAVLPFYLPLLGFDFRIARTLRLFRLLRLFKISRYTKALHHISKVFQDKKEELGISLTFTTLLLLLASTLMYFAEHEAQPEVFSSIPETMWWGIATLTTVGYGDVYPVTALGKLLGGIIPVIGIGLFALPTGILASGFSEKLSKEDAEVCPRCGKTPESASIQ